MTKTSSSDKKANKPFSRNPVLIWVKPNKIKLLSHHRDLDQDHLNELHEKVKVSRHIAPIYVRRAKVEGKQVLCLVAGKYKLAVAKLEGKKKIACYVIKGSDDRAELIAIGDDLWKKNLTVLRKSELMIRWYELALKYAVVSGQVVQKGRFGRPPGGWSEAARVLPVIGRSVEARRKVLARAARIAGITPEGKVGAKEAGLDNNQQALLRIASASGFEAQVRMAIRLGQKMRSVFEPALPAPASSTREPTSHAETQQSEEEASTSEAAGTEASEETSSDAPDETETPATAPTLIPVSSSEDEVPTAPDTTYEQLRKVWDVSMADLWLHATLTTRNRFYTYQRKAELRAKSDIVDFLRTLFSGRKSIPSEVLYAYAESKGIDKDVLRFSMKALGYKSRKCGKENFRTWHRTNPDKDWKDTATAVEHEELYAPADAKREEEAEFGESISMPKNKYYLDIASGDGEEFELEDPEEDFRF